MSQFGSKWIRGFFGSKPKPLNRRRAACPLCGKTVTICLDGIPYKHKCARQKTGEKAANIIIPTEADVRQSVEELIGPSLAGPPFDDENDGYNEAKDHS